MLESPDRYRAVGFAIGWAILAGVIGLLVWFMIRSHPERWLARRFAVAGVVTIVAAGAFQLAAAGLAGRCDVRGGTLIDCVGVTPWIVVAPALAIGGDVAGDRALGAGAAPRGPRHHGLVAHLSSSPPRRSRSSQT